MRDFLIGAGLLFGLGCVSVVLGLGFCILLIVLGAGVPA